MKTIVTPRKFHPLLKGAIPPLLVTSFLWAYTQNALSSVQLLIALALLYLPWLSYIRWKQHSEEILPLFALIAFMYWLYYAVPLFWATLIVSDRSSPLGREVSGEAVTSALLMALLGVCVLWLGMNASGRVLKFRRFPGLTLKPAMASYVRLLLVVSSLLGFSESLPLALGSGGRQGLLILIGSVPTLAFVILFRNYIHGNAKAIDKVLIIFFLGTRLVTGLSSGWLGSFASIIVICAAVYLAELKKIPRLISLIAIVFILFFQVGKEDFRRVYWQEGAVPTGRIERVNFWMQASIDRWAQMVSNPTGETVRDVLNPSVSRVSLLTQAANVIELTPSVVPYQYGQLYSYMVITFIPRFIWPDKPSMSEANQFYQVAYGLSSEEELASVSIAVGVLAEGYISFGWPGAMVVMFLLGVFFDVYRRLFLTKKSAGFMIAVGIVLLPQMLAVESQMAAYLGGILQQVAFTIIVFFPAISFKSNRVVNTVRLTPNANRPRDVLAGRI